MAGERDPKVLARHRHRRVKASEADIAKALTGNWREEHLFVLKQALGVYDDIGRHLAECDARLDELLDARATKVVDIGKPPRQGNKSRIEHDIRHQRLADWAAVDLTRINGLGLFGPYGTVWDVLKSGLWWPGAESKDSPRLAPALNLANSPLLPGYTFARAKPVSGDQEPNHRQICLRDRIISEAPRVRTPVDDSRLVARGGYDALSLAFGYDPSQLISKHLSTGTVG